MSWVGQQRCGKEAVMQPQAYMHRGLPGSAQGTILSTHRSRLQLRAAEQLQPASPNPWVHENPSLPPTQLPYHHLPICMWTRKRTHRLPCPVEVLHSPSNCHCIPTRVLLRVP